MEEIAIKFLGKRITRNNNQCYNWQFSVTPFYLGDTNAFQLINSSTYQLIN